MNLAYKKKFMSDKHQDVNYVKHWNYVSEMMPDIEGFTPVHMSLYNAIFHTWNSTGFKVWFDAYRDELMKLSMIKGRATYHKTMKDLVAAGLIEYRSNKSIYKSSDIRCIRFDDVQEIGFTPEIEQETSKFKGSSKFELDSDSKFTKGSKNELHSSSQEVQGRFTGSSNIEHFPKEPKLPKEPKQEKDILSDSVFSKKSDCSELEAKEKKEKKPGRRAVAAKKEKEPIAEVWPTFEDFWNAYDKKTGKKDALLKWKGIKQKDREALMLHIEQYKIAQPNKKWRKDPKTYLNSYMWTDEEIISNTPAPSVNRFQAQKQSYRPTFQDMAQKAKEVADSISFEDIKNL